jgi:hypothetical protein
MQSDRYWFPGRWVNGISLIVALPLWLAGTLVRLSFHFFFRSRSRRRPAIPRESSSPTSLIVAGIVVTAPCSATFVSLGQAHAPSATRFRLTSQAETIVVGTPPWSK